MTAPAAVSSFTPLADWLNTPIGPDDRYGLTLYDKGYRLAARVGRTMVVINPSKPYGFGEHLEHGELGGLWFNAEKALRDYDGVFQMSLEYAAAVELLGYTVTEYCTTDEIEAKAKAAGGYVKLAVQRGLTAETIEIQPRA